MQTAKFLVLSLVGILSASVEARPFKLSISEILPPVHLLEGGAVGSGGGSIVCKDPATQQIKTAELLDFFEARAIRDIKIDIQKFPGSWKEKAQATIERLGKRSILRQKVYSIWLSQFEKEAKFLKGVEFSKTQDSMHIGVPVGCEFIQAAVQILPRLPGDNRYYINQDIWDALDENSKAGLVLHEMVYREALSYGHTDSILARYFVENITSSAFEKFDDFDFKTLAFQCHFEQTDIEWAPEFKIKYNPLRWWRTDQSSSPGHPQMIELAGRMIMQLGICRGQGCSTFEELLETPMHTPVCNGLETVILPNKTEINFKWRNIENRNASCGAHVLFGYFNNEFQVKLRLHDDEEKLSNYNDVMSVQEGERNLNATEARFNGTNFELISVMSDFLEIPGVAFVRGYPKIGGQSNCQMWFSFEDQKLRNIQASTSDAYENCGFEIILEKEPINVHLNFDRVGNIFLDENERFNPKGFGMIVGLDSHDLKYRLGCATSNENCLSILKSDDDGIPQMLELKGNVKFGYSRRDGEFSKTSCLIQKGNVELHPGTVVPKVITTRGDCTLEVQLTENLGAEAMDFKVGSTLELDATGVVIRTLSGGTL